MVFITLLFSECAVSVTEANLELLLSANRKIKTVIVYLPVFEYETD